MILLEPFPNKRLRSEIVHTVLKAEDAEDIAAIMVFRFYTVAVIKDKRKDETA